MPYLFGGLVLLNALSLGYYLFVQQPAPTPTLKEAHDNLIKPISFINSAKYIPPPIGKKD